SYLTLAVDVLLAIYIIGKGVKHKKYLAVVLAVIQVVIVVWYELSIAHGIAVETHVYVDTLSLIMALIVGVIGSGICLYSIGYMRDYVHEHRDRPDNSPIFFALLFAFLSAMFALVFSNNLMWLFTAWEVTTVCSFALIGYTRTQEAIDNSFRQIAMNLMGGLGFAIALVFIGMQQGSIELDKLIEIGVSGSAALVPIALLCFAAITKAAQLPFHSWLLGAMVAPTPTSALLHSSTMVKAGVFLLIKLAPALGFNAPGIMIMLVGGFTFTLCSFMAISQRNAKRVLAYSTIANLGLITACAGVGTPEAIWAAIFLLIFHATAKSLLFLCVGTAEHHIGSRDIEDMDYLFVRMPRLSRFMLLGILLMFIAPFGMLISKWAALQSFIDSGNLVLVFLLAFGSAATFFFWAKWIGKLSAYAANKEDIEGTVHTSEWVAISAMAVLAIGGCFLFPVISSQIVVPYLEAIPAWGTAISCAATSSTSSFTALSQDNLWLVAIISVFVVLILIALPSKMAQKHVPIYLSGVAMDDDDRTFRNSFSKPQEATQSNWYLEGMFGEDKIDNYAVWIGIVLLVIGILASVVFGGVF
ncbi:MAG: NADH-quinone oxidoreductase subunit L, partial [Actinobacteria bacterium]|nr:NADH-quinone oxidoreductase subunit L [Actinomycetota bacterium]